MTKEGNASYGGSTAVALYEETHPKRVAVSGCAIRRQIVIVRVFWLCKQDLLVIDPVASPMICFRRAGRSLHAAMQM